MAHSELAPRDNVACEADHVDRKSADNEPRSDVLCSRFAQLEKVELACLDESEEDPRCLGAAIVGLKKIVAYYEQAILRECSNPARVLHLRKELQTYVALLRTVERFETLELRRAEIQKSEKFKGKRSKGGKIQFFS